MSVLHSFADLRHEFFTRAVPAPVPPDVPALPNDVSTGSIIHYRHDKINFNYPKPGEYRPALVMAVWRDTKGNAKIFEVAQITTNVSVIRREDLHSRFPGYHEAFPDHPEEKISPKNIVFVPNRMECVRPRMSKVNRSGLKAFLPDLLVRRAYSLLRSSKLEWLGEKPSPFLIRDGFTFDEIQSENLYMDGWQPDILGNDAIHVKRPDHIQGMVNFIARFAEFYQLQQRDRDNTEWSFPHHKEWPKSLPKMTFVDHSGSRWEPSRSERSQLRLNR